MRVIKPATVRSWAASSQDAAGGLSRWLEVVSRAHWRSLQDLREAFRSADEVRVQSGRKVVVFNIGGNKYRLIAAVHYNTGVVYALDFLSHAEYDTGQSLSG